MDQRENRLLTVVEHWLPRMEVAGIPSATAKAVIDKAGTWDNWLTAWSEEGRKHEEIAYDALMRNRSLTAGEAFARAALFYHFGQFMAFDDPDAKAAAARRKVDLYRQALPLLDPPGRVIAIPFEAGTLHAVLRIPASAGPVPLVVIIPGSDSTKEEFPAFERHFHLRSMATLSLDGPGQGEGRSHGGLRPDIAPAIAAALAEVEGDDRLTGEAGLVGMAFGGFLALRAAAGLTSISSVVSINGFHDLGAFWDKLPAVYRDNMRYALAVEDFEGLARQFTLRDIALPPIPALVLHGGRDKIFPVDEAERTAEAWGSAAECHIFPEGNHVCNNIPWLYRPLVADWVAEHFASAAKADQ